MNKRDTSVVGLGEILWDMLPGKKVLGGAPANFAYYVQALGVRSFFAGSVGKDDLGKEMLKALGRLGIDRRYIFIDEIHPTGKVDVEIDKKGKPKYVFAENVAWDHIPFNRKMLKLARRASVVCFGTLTQRSSVSKDTIRRFLKTTRPDCIRIFDINLRQPFFDREIIVSTLRLSNVLKLNEDELQILCRLMNLHGSQEVLLSKLMEKFQLELIALTKGAKGSILFGRGKKSVHKGFRVKVVDTVGAGDSFSAALAAGLLKGDDLDKINAFANRLAGFVCTQPGAIAKLPADLKRY